MSLQGTGLAESQAFTPGQATVWSRLTFPDWKALSYPRGGQEIQSSLILQLDLVLPQRFALVEDHLLAQCKLQSEHAMK